MCKVREAEEPLAGKVGLEPGNYRSRGPGAAVGEPGKEFAQGCVG